MKAGNHIRALVLLLKDRVRPVVHPRANAANKLVEQKRKNFYATFLTPGALVFDVGANLGNRVDAFLRCGAKVVAFEPQSTCYQFLKLKFGNRITLRNCALGEKVTTATITLNRDSSTIATMSQQWKEEVGKGRFSSYRWGKTETVTVDTVENQVVRFGIPYFVKIDVEGFEEQVLKGLKTPVPMISFEYTTPEMAEAAINCIRILNALSSLYEYNFAVGETTSFENKHWLDYSAMRHLLDNNIDALKGFGDIYARLKK